MTGDGIETNEIRRHTGLCKVSVWRWQERYIEAGVDGLLRHKTWPSRIHRFVEEKVAEVVRLTPWTGRAMAERSGVSTAMVRRI